MAAGQAVLQAYTHENSVITATMFSVLGSLLLAAAIIIPARHDQGTKNRRPPGRHAQ